MIYDSGGNSARDIRDAHDFSTNATLRAVPEIIFETRLRSRIRNIYRFARRGIGERTRFWTQQHVIRNDDTGRLTLAGDHVAINLDQGYQQAISDPLI